MLGAIEQSYAPLFAKEFCDIAEKDIDRVFVEPWNTPRRKELAVGLRLFLAHLRSLGVNSYEIWINGSFATKKPSPTDADIVCFVSRETLDGMNDSELEELSYLASREGRAYVRARWGCDYYYCPFEQVRYRNQFKNKFATDRNGSIKGIGRIMR